MMRFLEAVVTLSFFLTEPEVWIRLHGRAAASVLVRLLVVSLLVDGAVAQLGVAEENARRIRELEHWRSTINGVGVVLSGAVAAVVAIGGWMLKTIHHMDNHVSRLTAQNELFVEVLKNKLGSDGDGHINHLMTKARK